MSTQHVNLASNAEQNEKFIERFFKRHPEQRANYKRLLETTQNLGQPFEASLETSNTSLARVYETIVLRERPVLFIQDGKFNTQDVTAYGSEAVELVAKLKDASETFLPLLPLIGRIDVKNFPSVEYLGTGWFVDKEIIVTNRHVARYLAEWNGNEFIFRRGIADQPLECSLCNAHEYDDAVPQADRIFKIKAILYIEPDNQPNDIAFIRVERNVSGLSRPYIAIASQDVADDQEVCVVGYPARGVKKDIPDQALMKSLFLDRYDVKRAAPGLGMGTQNGLSEHDCTTLGGNSGSVVLNYSGEAVGLHFAGKFKTANYAVPASKLIRYIQGKQWENPSTPVIQTERKKDNTTKKGPSVDPSNTSKSIGHGSQSTQISWCLSTSTPSQTITIPLTITIHLGSPTIGISSGSASGVVLDFDSSDMEATVKSYWNSKPAEVLAARVGYFDDADGIGDTPCIAASLPPARWTELESSLPADYFGVPIRYFPANIDEQLQASPQLESVDSIAYDDDARGDKRFSFDEVDEEMELIAHVGPEYSWIVLKEFLSAANGTMDSAMYEFHAKHIADVLEERLEAGLDIRMVLDNVTFSKLKPKPEHFDRIETFKRWADDFTFDRIVAAEGLQGLISDAYHIKVTVRQDNAFWLSSGNWKPDSSQPVITEDQLLGATEEDLPGNREWHVVLKSKRLANFFRSHIRQDFKRSAELGARELPKSKLTEETFVDVPIEETVVLERRAPSRILEPLRLKRRIKVRPLLTPDKEGAIYSKAVLSLIKSAKKSLLFQIPYIGMPSNPNEDRGFIDELILALVKKLKELDDARVLLRSGGSRFSSPTHAAWFFKSKGVDIANRLKVMEDHHTKGMIVDDRMVLLGSHNWSKPGVTLNRDASLIFDDAEVAAYYRQAFEIDWDRASRLKPKKFIKESPALEAVGAAPPVGYKRVPLSELMSDD